MSSTGTTKRLTITMINNLEQLVICICAGIISKHVIHFSGYKQHLISLTLFLQCGRGSQIRCNFTAFPDPPGIYEESPAYGVEINFSTYIKPHISSALLKLKAQVKLQNRPLVSNLLLSGFRCLPRSLLHEVGVVFNIFSTVN